MIDLKDVPAWLPLIPAFAISPIAVAVSSILYFMDPANGATYLKVSPIIATLVLELLDAFASTSAKCPESFAFNPKAVIESVTMSDTVPRSSPEAAAKFITPDNPETIWFVFHPAIAMYLSAVADSVAENFVVAPICFAFADSFSRSFPDAPEIA